MMSGFVNPDITIRITHHTNIDPTFDYSSVK